MSVFIGRERDVMQLGEYMQDALQGKGKVVFIVGEAGIGKTRLIEEFKAQHLDAHNAAMQSQQTSKVSPDIRFAEAKCNELAGKGEAYAPFFEMIAQFVADDKAFGSSKLAEIVREVGSDWFELVPVIGKALSLISKTFFKWRKSDDVRQLADRQVQKEKLVQEFTHILKRMSDEHPLVLFLDDLHWADESSIALLFHIARHLQEQRILILGTYRPTDIEAARGDKAHPLKDVVYELHRYDLCATIKLGYLTKAHIRGFLDAYLGQHALDAAFVDYLHDLTEGNPLFVTEYVKLLQEIGKLIRTPQTQTSKVSKTFEVSPSEVSERGAWTLRGTLRDADMPIPTSVEKVIEKRVERLKEELQKTLKYASVNGEQFNTLVLAKLLNWDELELLEKLEALSRVHQLVKEINLAPGQTPRGAVYQFIHSLVQKSLYATLSAGIKSKLHAKAAEILEEVYHDDLETVVEELVEHYSRGQNHAHAAKYALLAARKANRQAGFHEARAHAQRGLELLKLAGFIVETHGRASLPKTPDQTMLRLQIELLIELATAEEAIGEAKNSIEHAEIAAKLAEAINDQNFQSEIYYQVGNLLIENRSTNLERIVQLLKTSLGLKIAIKDYENVIRVLERIYEPSWTLGKMDDFLKSCQQIISLNQEARQTQLNIPVIQFMAMVLYGQGKLQEAYDTILQGLEITFKTENYSVQMEMLQYIIEYAVKSGHVSDALTYYEKSKIIANTVNDKEVRAMVFFRLGFIAWHVGKYDEGLEHLRIAREITQNTGNLEMEGRVLSTLRWRYREIGMFDEAIQYGLEHLEISQKLGRASTIMEAFDGLAWIFRHQGNYVKALEMIQQATALAKRYERERGLATYLRLCYLTFMLLGKFQEAIDAIGEALNIYRKVKDRGGEIECLTNLAISYLYLGHIDDSLLFINDAVRINQTITAKNVSISLLMRQSYILMKTGRYKDANTVLESVIEETMNRLEWTSDLHLHLINNALLYLAFDQPEQALTRLPNAEKFLKKYVFIEGIALLKDAYAHVYLAQGEFAKAETSLNEAIALFQQMNSFRLGEADLTLAALRLAQNQPDAALQAAADAHKIFQEIEYYRLGEAILWEAKSHLALRHFSEIRANLAAANAIFTRQQQPHHAAEAKLVEGQLLLAELREQKTSNVSETFEVSKRLFTEAQATFAELGLKRLENEAAQQIKDFKSLEDF